LLEHELDSGKSEINEDNEAFTQPTTWKSQYRESLDPTTRTFRIVKMLERLMLPNPTVATQQQQQKRQLF